MFSHAIALLLVLTTALTAGPRPASAQTQFAIINQPPVCKDIHGLFAWTSTPPSGDPWPGPDAGGFATVGAGTSRFWPCRLTNAPGGTPLPGYSSSLEPIKFCNIGYNGIEMAGDPPSSQWLTKLGPGLSATLNWVSLGNVGADPPEQFRFPRGSFVSGGTVPAYPGSDRVICAARGSEHLGPGHSSNFFIGYSQLPYPGYPDDNGACWIGVGGSQKKFVTDVHFLMVTNRRCINAASITTTTTTSVSVSVKTTVTTATSTAFQVVPVPTTVTAVQTVVQTVVVPTTFTVNRVQTVRQTVFKTKTKTTTRIKTITKRG